MLEKIKKIFQNEKFILRLYFILPVFITVRAIIFSAKSNESIGNNFLIFKYSFLRLIENNSMYVFFTNLDLFKYSPTFAVWMAPFYFMNDKIGYFIFIAIHTFVLLYAVYKLPKIEKKYVILFLWFILNELVTSLMNCQTNSLIVGLIILAIITIEEKKIAISTLFIIIAFFIKPYALAGCIMYIFYENKIKIVMYSILWFLIFAAFPFMFVSLDSYIFQLNEWKIMLQNDHSASFGMSVMGLFKNNLMIEAKNQIILLGTIILFIPLINLKSYSYFEFRMKFLASILIWMVIFNHKAESPTFIIAVCGVAIWYYYSEKSIFNLVLLLFVLILTQLGNTDIYPSFIRNEFLRPRDLKALPCLLVWLKVNYELLRFKSIIK